MEKNHSLTEDVRDFKYTNLSIIVLVIFHQTYVKVIFRQRCALQRLSTDSLNREGLLSTHTPVFEVTGTVDGSGGRKMCSKIFGRFEFPFAQVSKMTE
jgi:hypothetical protein